jgi:hypothetical protein
LVEVVLEVVVVLLLFEVVMVVLMWALHFGYPLLVYPVRIMEVDQQ